jgi:hypothetical protein
MQQCNATRQYNATRRPYNTAHDALVAYNIRRYHSLAIGSGRTAHLAGIDTKHAPEASEASDQDSAHADLKPDLCRKGALHCIIPKRRKTSFRGGMRLHAGGRAVVVMNWWHSGHCISVG